MTLKKLIQSGLTLIARVGSGGLRLETKSTWMRWYKAPSRGEPRDRGAKGGRG